MAIGSSDRFLVNGYNLADWMQSFEATAEAEPVDSTVLSSTYRQYQQGFKNGSIECSGVFDADTTDDDEIHDVLSAAFVAGSSNIVTAGIGSFAIGGNCFMLNGCQIKYEMPIEIGELITVSAEFQGSSAINFGKFLMSSAVGAGTTNGTGVDNGAATTNGGLFHSHLFNDDATGVRVICQHSTNGSVWADLAEVEDFAGVRATGGYTFALNPSDTNTIVFNGVTFNFLDTVVDPTTDIDIKGTLALTMIEAAVVLNASVDADVSVATYTATATGISVEYDAPGTGGNAYTLDTANGGNSTRTAATLAGGTDSASAHVSGSVAVTGTVNRHLRAVAAVSGGDTFLVSAAFARR